MKRFRKLLLFFTLLVFSFSLRAQELDSLFNLFAEYFPKERVHVHFDKSVYNKEETIWYKVYILDNQGITRLSKNLYVEWFDTSGTFIRQTIAPLFQGTAKGSFDLPADYKGNFIRMKVYTRWSLNDDPAFQYQRDITINNDDGKGIKTYVPIKTTVTAFPEGGDLVTGLTSLVAFKSNDQSGRPINIKALLLNNKNKVIDTLRLRHNGMGSFILIPLPGESYSIKWSDNFGNAGILPLPAAKNQGVVMSVRQSGEFASVKIDRTTEVPQNMKHMKLLVHMDQQVLFKVDIHAADRTSLFAKIPIEELNTGVLKFTLFTEDWKPISERISFVNNRYHEFGAKLIPQLISLTKRGKNVLDVLVSDTTVTNMSISITDASVVDETKLGSIYSDLLLSNEIKGRIFNPAYYLSSDSDTVAAHLDLVMLTHGWRKYDWEKIHAGQFPQLQYLPETETIRIRGKVYGLKSVSASDLMLNIILQNKDSSKSFLFQQVSKEGLFESREQIFYDTARLYYSFNQNPKLNDLTQIQFENGLMKPSAKAIAYEYGSGDPTWNDSVARARLAYFLSMQEDWKNRSQYKTLQEVIIKTRAKPKEDALDQRYATGLFAGGDALVFDFMNDPLSSGAIDIFTYLQARVPGLMINRAGMSTQLIWRGGTPDVYLDQMLVGTEFIQSLNIRDIALIKVFRPPFFGSIGGGSSGAIAIYTQKGSDRRADDGKNSKGMLTALLAGYTRFKEFYSPQYDDPTVKPDTDIRTTLVWEPYVITNKRNPRHRIQFFNNDVSKKLLVVLEGINVDGMMTRVVKYLE
ncbi:MAG: hypothetical protein RIQ50_846 [Bacteroidota bacterium]